jgi:hypothetical protein
LHWQSPIWLRLASAPIVGHIGGIASIHVRYFELGIAVNIRVTHERGSTVKILLELAFLLIAGVTSTVIICRNVSLERELTSR